MALVEALHCVGLLVNPSSLRFRCRDSWSHTATKGLH